MTSADGLQTLSDSDGDTGSDDDEHVYVCRMFHSRFSRLTFKVTGQASDAVMVPDLEE